MSEKFGPLIFNYLWVISVRDLSAWPNINICSAEGGLTLSLENENNMVTLHRQRSASSLHTMLKLSLETGHILK